MNKLIIFFLVAGIVLGFGLSQYIGIDFIKDFSKKDFIPEQIPNSKQEIVENCQNLSLKETSLCLRDNVKTFYNFKVNGDENHLTFEELKKSGGDCRDYAFLYKELGEDLNFNSDTLYYTSKIDGIPSHRFAVLYNETDYCKLDLLEVGCYERD